MAVNTEAGTLGNISANDLITRAYRILGDIAHGEAITAAQASVGLEALNAMLEAFSIERLMIYEVRQESFSWPASTSSRTIGVGADFSTHRPERIEPGTFFRDSNIDYPVDVVLNRDVYDTIADKTSEGAYPEILYYNPSMTWGTIYVYPVPSKNLTFLMNTWQPLQYFDNLTENHAMPSGYRRMLAYNLARELEGETGLPCPASALQIAGESKKAIKRHNSVPILSATESAYVLKGGRKADIMAGE